MMSDSMRNPHTPVTLLLALSLAAGTALAAPGAEPRAARSANPLAGKRLFVDPDTNAARDAEALRSENPDEANLIDRIASRPQATWLTGESWETEAAIERLVTTAKRAGALRVLVAYNVPKRDCGSYSAGGARTAKAYLRWIRAIARGVGSRPVAVILEPDAVAGLHCLSSTNQRRRLALLRHAVEILDARPHVAVYIDAGHSLWQPVEVMKRRLRQAGIGRAHGFSLNVSNFNRTEDEVAFGRRLSRATGSEHFVIDTSRNGRGPAPNGEWCNPPGRGLGTPPRTRDLPSRLVDALLWIKSPGESDGACNGAPPAGTWWREYALGLARRASR
jgi:endoglucanase